MPHINFHCPSPHCLVLEKAPITCVPCRICLRAHSTPGIFEGDQSPPTAGRWGAPILTSTLKEVAVDVLDGGVDGRPGGDTARSDIRVILGIDVLKSFPWNSRMELCLWKPKRGLMLEHLHIAS